MAQTKFSVNLSAADFVLSHTFKGRSVIIPGPDQNYFQGTAGWAGNTPQRGIDIPQVYYCENTVPTTEGYRSISYRYFINPPAPTQRFVRIFTVFDGNANSALVGVTADRKLYIVSAYTGGEWQLLTLPAGFSWTAASDITNTTIRGSIAFCIRGLGFFVLSVVLSTLYKVDTVLGVDDTKVHGICAAAQYLVTWDADTIYWSSTEDAWDFTPSLITGAGSAKPDGLKGKIVLCKELSGGFIIYSDASIISAAYSSNLQIPWIFDPLAGGGGIRTPEAVAYDMNMQQHFAWTSGGFLAIDLHQITPQFPQVTDFIASGLSDASVTYDAFPTSTYLDTDKEVRLSIISNRYVCISFGTLSAQLPGEFRIPKLTQTFLWDAQLKRWGKLNVDHIQLFEAPFTASPPVFF